MKRVGSLFSGAGGFDIGFAAAGFAPAFFCEIDPMARAVLARHWPEVPCYEDIRVLDGRALPRVDCITAGFPCQDVSVAGKRAGLAGERTGLFWELARIIGELRPTWLCLENVPGLLSSNGTEDLGAILWELGELGYGWAYRVLDAQHWGVPQRRRRVFIVGRAGGLVNRAAAVLFESDRSTRDSPAGREAGQGAARSATACADESSGVYCIKGAAIGREPENGPQYGEVLRDACYTLNATEVHVIADTVRSHPRPGSNSVGSLTIANTVRASAGHHGHSSPRGDGSDNLVVAGPVPARDRKGCNSDGDDLLVQSLAENQRGESAAWNGSTVRRLLPRECEKLQGWEPDWTRRTADSKELSDGARYRLIGNGVAAPVARWIAERILTVESAS